MINKRLTTLAFALVAAAACQSFAEPDVKPVATPAVETASTTAVTADVATTSPEFPLMLKGTEVLISRDASRADLSAKLTPILGEATEMEEAARLQYDFQITTESAPVTLVIDWDEAGKIAEICIDGEDVPTKDLQAWLEKNAGAGKDGEPEDGYKNTVWEHLNWKFTLRAGGDGEETAFSFTIVPLSIK
ncbi:MAG TPA: hypothetical protein PLM07_10840 [Candidatus Rifleibacterium sp.]|nr:hypothetical protein [Candidatus Rifleibacterium sp.]HPT46388.1 hypothetical protein [Candidatus Rifleibacterium sp.]